MFAIVIFHLWEVGTHTSCIGTGDVKPRVYFCFSSVAFDFWGYNLSVFMFRCQCVREKTR